MKSPTKNLACSAGRRREKGVCVLCGARRVCATVRGGGEAGVRRLCPLRKFAHTHSGPHRHPPLLGVHTRKSILRPRFAHWAFEEITKRGRGSVLMIKARMHYHGGPSLGVRMAPPVHLLSCLPVLLYVLLSFIIVLSVHTAPPVHLLSCLPVLLYVRYYCPSLLSWVSPQSHLCTFPAHAWLIMEGST